MADEYEIGYGKPPTGKRFKPGQSGNPRGRPKGDQNFKTLFGLELSEKVAVKQNGRRRKLSKRVLIVKKSVSEAIAGNYKHLQTVLAFDPLSAEVLAEVADALARPQDDAVQASLIERLRRAAATDEQTPSSTDEGDLTP